MAINIAISNVWLRHSGCPFTGGLESLIAEFNNDATTYGRSELLPPNAKPTFSSLIYRKRSWFAKAITILLEMTSLSFQTLYAASHWGDSSSRSWTNKAQTRLKKERTKLLLLSIVARTYNGFSTAAEYICWKSQQTANNPLCLYRYRDRYNTISTNTATG